MQNDVVQSRAAHARAELQAQEATVAAVSIEQQASVTVRAHEFQIAMAEQQAATAERIAAEARRELHGMVQEVREQVSQVHNAELRRAKTLGEQQAAHLTQQTQQARDDAQASRAEVERVRRLSEQQASFLTQQAGAFQSAVRKDELKVEHVTQLSEQQSAHLKPKGKHATTWSNTARRK